MASSATDDGSIVLVERSDGPDDLGISIASPGATNKPRDSRL